jgi:hypothetical protein
MIRYDCFEWLAPLLTDQLVVTSLSGQRVEWGHLSKRDADLNLGSMGNALAVGIGLALAAAPKSVGVRIRRQRAALAFQSANSGQFKSS